MVAEVCKSCIKMRSLVPSLPGIAEGCVRVRVKLEQFSNRKVPLVETRRVLRLLYSLNAEGSFLGKVHPFRERL